MKKIFSIFMLLFMAMPFVSADEVITQDPNRLPRETVEGQPMGSLQSQ